MAAAAGSRSLTSAREGHSVADRENNAIDPLIACNFGVELAHRHRVWIGLLRVGDPPKPKHVVEDNQATRSNQPQRTIILSVIFLFFDVDQSPSIHTRRSTLNPLSILMS